MCTAIVLVRWLTNEAAEETVDHREHGKEVQGTVQCRLGRLQDVDIEQGTHQHHHDEGEEVKDQHDGLSGEDELAKVLLVNCGANRVHVVLTEDTPPRGSSAACPRNWARDYGTRCTNRITVPRDSFWCQWESRSHWRSTEWPDRQRRPPGMHSNAISARSCWT